MAAVELCCLGRSAVHYRDDGALSKLRIDDNGMLPWLWRVMSGANCRADIIGPGPLGCLKVAAASVAFVLITPGCIWWGASKLTPYVFLLVDLQ